MDKSKIYFKKNKFNKKRDYYKKNFYNPFFLKDHKKAAIWVNTILIALILFGVYYFFQFTTYWQIKKFFISGGGSITQNLVLEIAQQQQLNRKFLIFTQDKIIFFDTNSFKKSIQNQILLENIKINKNYTDKTIEINLVERVASFYLKNQGQFFTLDKSGNLINILESIPTSTFPILEFWPYNLTIGAKIADLDYLSKLIYLNENWSKTSSQTQIGSFEILENYQDKVIINTANNYKIKLNGQVDLDKQIETLHNLYLRLEKDNLVVTEYIDLSNPGWVYYK